MKQIFSILLLFYACFLQAGVIVTKNNGSIEDAMSISVKANVITYQQDGQLKSINKEEVTAVLYDNGRYEEITNSSIQTNTAPNQLPGQDEFLFSEKATDVILFSSPLLVASAVVNNAMSNSRERFFLCILAEDAKAYSAYLREHKDIKNQYTKSLKQAEKENRWYEVAWKASRAYKVCKEDGKNGYDASAALINTFIQETNNH